MIICGKKRKQINFAMQHFVKLSFFLKKRIYVSVCLKNRFTVSRKESISPATKFDKNQHHHEVISMYNRTIGNSCLQKK